MSYCPPPPPTWSGLRLKRVECVYLAGYFFSCMCAQSLSIGYPNLLPRLLVIQLSVCGCCITRSKDRLVSYGERMSVRLMAATLNKLGIPAQHFDAWSLGMRTTNDFGNAEILEESYPTIRENLSKFDPSM